MRRKWRLVAATFAATIAMLGGIAAVVGVLGLYNVAASAGHWPIVELLLRIGMERSVKLRAPSVAPDLRNEAMVRVGAGHYEIGCAYCHGSPIRPISPVARAMLPPPPDLGDRVGEWRDGELFWIVRHGIKYAGMPSWPADGRDDEVWSMVAFLRRLPGLDAAGYRRLALASQAAAPSSIIARCAACHGMETAPESDLVPVIHGQGAARLLLSLRRYRSGDRSSGVMQQAVHDLSDDELRVLAETYAALAVPERSAATSHGQAAVARGERLAAEGDAPRGIPACNVCHSGQALAIYPRLAGQPAAFLAAQLRAFRSGSNERGIGIVMTHIARQMSEADIAAAAAYFSARPRGATP